MPPDGPLDLPSNLGSSQWRDHCYAKYQRPNVAVREGVSLENRSPGLMPQEPEADLERQGQEEPKYTQIQAPRNCDVSQPGTEQDRDGQDANRQQQSANDQSGG